MIKNIFNLTRIFFINSFQNPYIIDKKTNKINKKSIFVWLIFIIAITISYLSFEVIKVLVKINQATMFLNIFFLILNMIIIFQIILACINVYFFSKDLELILPLPIKSEELIISKFNTILINSYFVEMIFAVFPLIIYGILTDSGILYYCYIIIVLLIFPILINLIISILMMFLIKLSKFIKNKDIFQLIITLIFILLVFFLEFKIFNNIIGKIDDNLTLESEQLTNEISDFNKKIEKINKYFLVTNTIIKILNNSNKLISLFYLIKLIFIDLLFLILFMFIGKKNYLKNILKNNNFYISFVKKDKLKRKCKKNNIGISYIKKEFKLLFRNPIFFIQCLFPTLILVVSIILIIIIGLPSFKTVLTSNLLR